MLSRNKNCQEGYMLLIFSVLPGAHWNCSTQYAFFNMSEFKSFAVKNLWCLVRSTKSLWQCAATLPTSAVQKSAHCMNCLCWCVQFNLIHIYIYILFKSQIPYLALHFPNSYKLAFKGYIALCWCIWDGRHWIARKTSILLLPIQHWGCTEIWTSGLILWSLESPSWH